jgi:riboflavin-specific deaminase-like protein
VIKKTPPTALPRVFLNVAISADGKLAPANRKFEPFGSKRDRELMMELRAEADAIMTGATTADQTGVTLSMGGPKYRELRPKNKVLDKMLRVIVSGSGSIRPGADLFKDRSTPIIILTSERTSGARLKRLKAVADEVGVFGDESVNFTEALRWLRTKFNVKSLLSEGGGGLNAALFEEDLVDDIYVTICPLIFGGREAPTMADGRGVERLADATRLKLKSLKQVKDELFLVYSVIKKP